LNAYTANALKESKIYAKFGAGLRLLEDAERLLSQGAGLG